MNDKNAPVKIALLIILSLITLVITACQSPQILKSDKEKLASRSAGNFSREQETQDLAKRKKEGKAAAKKEEIAERKIIKKANLRLEKKNLSQISEKIHQLVENYDGYVSDSRKWQGSDQRKYYTYELRVPQKDFMTVISEIKNLGKLKNEQITANDITTEYIDLKARLKNFKAQEKRYLNLLNEAKKVDDILKIEKELNRVRTNIERLQGQFKYYNNKINLATINVRIEQPKSIINSNSGWGIMKSFRRAISNFIDSINAIIVLIGGLIPWIILVSLVGFISYKVFVFKRRQD